MHENNIILNESNTLSQVNSNSENYTLIEVNSRKYAIKTQKVREIVKVMELDYSHQMPSYVLGIMKIDKMPIGVLDLREIFKKERIIYGLSAKIIVIKTENIITSIICDRVCDIKKIDKSKIQLVPYQHDAVFFDGVYEEDNESIYVLNIENVLNYTQKNIEKFRGNQNSLKYLLDDEESKQILRARKEFLARISADFQTPSVLYDKGVSFSINNVKYYINMSSVKEFYKVNNSKFIKVPNTQDYIFGLINIKGEYITVLDFRRFLNCPKTQIKEKSTIIILNSEEFKIGILADEICESMDVDLNEIVQNRLQNQEENKMLEFVKEGEIYQVVDVEKLFNDERLTIV